MTEYTAKDLSEVADYFETLASDQRRCVRFQSLKREKQECETTARIWDEAAKILRNMTLTGGK